MKKRYKLTIGLIGILLCAWSFFQGREYLRGNRFIPYLQQHMETVEIGKTPEFSILNNDLEQHQILLVGEIHGFKVPQALDHEIFSFLNSNHNFKTYLLEMDVSQAYYMNLYNKTGSDSLLRRILKQWVVSPGRDNQDYSERFRMLHKIYQSGDGFTYLGTDGISDLELLRNHLTALLPSYSWEMDRSLEDSVNLKSLQKQLTPIISKPEALDIPRKDLIDLRMINKNISYALTNTYREEILTQNVLDLYDYYELKEQKVYGFFGLGHTLKAPVQGGYEAMASRLKHSDSWFDQHLLTANFIFTDSHMVMPSQSLPSFLQDEGPLTRTSVSHDNIWLSYLYGIEDLKRITRKGSTTIFRLNGDNSPYRNSQRLIRLTQILPMGQLFQADEKFSTTDYMDYIILIRDSDWAEPIM